MFLKLIILYCLKNLENPSIEFYIYQTPPVQKITPKNENISLYDYDCVPGGLFYFGVNDPKLEKEKYILKKQIIDQAFLL